MVDKVLKVALINPVVTPFDGSRLTIIRLRIKRIIHGFEYLQLCMKSVDLTGLLVQKQTELLFTIHRLRLNADCKIYFLPKAPDTCSRKIYLIS